jgi:RNA polymerase sigma-70 factor, ECF subfamily
LQLWGPPRDSREAMWGAANGTNPLRRRRFDLLVALHTARLEAVARQLCREPATAADLVQDTFERAWRRFDSLRDDDRARAWLVRIMQRIWLDKLRRPPREVPIEDTHDAPAITDEPSRWEHVTIEEIRHAIEQLPERFRTVAVLHDIDGKTYREIAEHLKIPYATAATRLYRAHQRIKQLVLGSADGGDDDEDGP